MRALVAGLWDLDRGLVSCDYVMTRDRSFLRSVISKTNCQMIFNSLTIRLDAAKGETKARIGGISRLVVLIQILLPLGLVIGHKEHLSGLFTEVSLYERLQVLDIVVG